MLHCLRTQLCISNRAIKENTNGCIEALNEGRPATSSAHLVGSVSLASIAMWMAIITLLPKVTNSIDSARAAGLRQSSVRLQMLLTTTAC